MICQACKQREALVHIRMIDYESDGEIVNHFCLNCADVFCAAEPTCSPANAPLINLRVLRVSPQRTLVKVLSGIDDSEDWEFLTSRLRQLDIEACPGEEFAIQHRNGWIDWLKGKRECPE
jgi:hypothetical protein